MGEYEETRRRELLNVRILGVLALILATGLGVVIVRAIQQEASDSRAKLQETRLACVTRGGAWIDGTGTAPSMCLPVGAQAR